MKKLSFAEWIKNQLDEIVLGSDGQRDNQVVQTSQATSKVGQNWLANKQNADVQNQLVTGTSHRSTLAGKLLDAGTQAVDSAPHTFANKTTAPLVANFLQSNLGLPKVLKPQKPGTFNMRKQ